MTDDARALLAQALETALRTALLQQADPLGWLRRVDAGVIPDLLATVEAGQRPDGSALADPAHAALVAEVLAAVVARLRDELEG
jgi:hypothetical protein